MDVALLCARLLNSVLDWRMVVRQRRGQSADGVAVVSDMSDFQWTEKATRAALALAAGKTRLAAAEEADIADRTLYRWLNDPAFSAEVDRLSLMTDIASRAERLRIAKRAVRQAMADDGKLITKADVLDWLKFAQSETDGIKLDLAAILATQTPLADSGSD